MKIQISAKNFNVTDSIREYMEDKLLQIERRIKDPSVQVCFEVHGNLSSVELFVTSAEHTFKIECNDDESLYIAIDGAVYKLVHQIDEYKKKKLSEKRASGKVIIEDSRSEKKRTCINKIVKRKEFEMKPMFEAEAIEQMNLLGHDFFMFFNADLEQICLLYRRKDNNFGIIETLY